MRWLLDTQLLLWTAGVPERLPVSIRPILEDRANILMFSAASLWEVVIKRSLGRRDFQVDPHVLRRGLLDNGYQELDILGPHILRLDGLPMIHKDPFDRILVAQAIVEGLTLVTTDTTLSQYPGPILHVSS
ncbi:MAG: type II toxin-antitoxin system VapC family toxin [Nitrospirae bacterium]|nr:type II toxin-antitoxin system VapC family toxin [Nitrospirota bacterium]